MRPLRLAFTLVELMISILVSAVLITAVYAFFMAQTRSYELQQMSTELDASLRFAQDMITKAIQGAGALSDLDDGTLCDYAGPLGGIDDANPPTVDEDGPLPCVMVDQPAGQSDQLTTVVPDGSTAFRVKVPNVNGDGARCDSQLTLTISQTADPVSFAGVQAMVAAGYDYMVCSDYSRSIGTRSFIFDATGTVIFGSVATLIVPDPGQNDFTAVCTSAEPHSLYIECAGAQIYTFYVATNTKGALSAFAPATYALFISPDMDMYMGASGSPRSTALGDADFVGVNDIPLAAGIADMQLEACLPGSDCAGNPSDWEDINSPQDYTLYEMWRVGLLARSSRTFPGSSLLDPPTLLNGMAFSGNADKGYMYRAVYFRATPLSRVDGLNL